MSGSQISGNFRTKKDNVDDIGFQDFINPWNFYWLLNQNDEIVNNWCRKNGLLLNSLPCTKEGARGVSCQGTMRIAGRSGKSCSQTLRCGKNRNHEVSVRTNSFFEKSKLTIQDVMNFIKCYLDNMTLLQCSVFSGVSYRSTAVDWASFIRECFKEYFQRHVKSKILKGEIEIDESLFGRRVKFHRGNPHKGLKVWVFGMVERESNTIILYPVSDRRQSTLVPLIQRHVQPGSTIYSDGWSAYCQLNDIGYRHFTVTHKYAFKKQYRNVHSGDIVTVHTNRMEGAWQHAKNHFRKMAGTKATQWEGHMAEVMWRSHAKGHVYEHFFELLRSIYTLHEPANLTYTTPLFDSWDGIPITRANADEISPAFTEWELLPCQSDVETSESDSDAQSSTQHGQSVAQSLTPGQYPTWSLGNPIVISSDDGKLPKSKQERDLQKMLSDMFSSSSSSSDNIAELHAHDKTITPSHTQVNTGNISAVSRFQVSDASTSTPAYQPHKEKHVAHRKKPVLSISRRRNVEKVCHPPGYVETKKEGEKTRTARKKASKTPSNPYTKQNFLMWSSSDDDFQ